MSGLDKKVSGSVVFVKDGMFENHQEVPERHVQAPRVYRVQAPLTFRLELPYNRIQVITAEKIMFIIVR